MANLIIEMPDDLVRSLEGLAAAEHKTVEQLAVEKLRSLVDTPPQGSPAAVMRAMGESPHLSASDVEELDAVIAAGRAPALARDLFSD